MDMKKNKLLWWVDRWSIEAEPEAEGSGELESSGYEELSSEKEEEPRSSERDRK